MGHSLSSRCNHRNAPANLLTRRRAGIAVCMPCSGCPSLCSPLRCPLGAPALYTIQGVSTAPERQRVGSCPWVETLYPRRVQRSTSHTQQDIPNGCVRREGYGTKNGGIPLANSKVPQSM